MESDAKISHTDTPSTAMTQLSNNLTEKDRMLIDAMNNKGTIQ